MSSDQSGGGSGHSGSDRDADRDHAGPLDASDRALRKLRTFMLELEPAERVALAKLIAPGVEQALAEDPIQEWTPDVVQRWLKGADGQRRGYNSDEPGR